MKRIMYDPEGWELPYIPVSLIDTHKSPNFEILYIYQGVYRVPYASILILMDIMICTILAHICAQCQLLQNALKRIVWNAYKQYDKQNEKVLIEISVIERQRNIS